jgi:hypothetical protein
MIFLDRLCWFLFTTQSVPFFKALLVHFRTDCVGSFLLVGSPKNGEIALQLVSLSTGERWPGGDVGIWLKTCWHNFLRGALREKLLRKLATFEKFRSSGKEEARPRGGNMEKSRRKKSPANHIASMKFA